MINDSESKVIVSIVSSKQKFRRAVILLVISGFFGLLGYGLYTGQLLKIIQALCK